MKSYRGTLLTAVIYSMIIATIYLTLGVLSMLVRSCDIDMKGSPTIYLMFLMFFRTEQCEPQINWSELGIESTVVASLPSESDTVRRTYIFTIAYLGVYGALAFFALLSILGLRNSCMGTKSFPFFFMPWILAACAVIVMDVLATVYHITDMINSFGDIDGVMQIIGVSNPDTVRSAFENLTFFTKFMAPFIMVLVTSKVFIFFIVDIIFIILITKAGWTASTYHKNVDTNYQRNISHTNSGFASSENNLSESKLSENGIQAASSTNPDTRYRDTSKETDTSFNYSDLSAGEPRKDQKVKQFIPRPSTLAIAYSERTANKDKNYEREIESRMSHYEASTSTNDKVLVIPLRDKSPVRDYDKEIDEIFKSSINSPNERPKSLEKPWEEDIPDKQKQQIRVRVLPSVFDDKRNSTEARKGPKVPPKPERSSNRVSMPPWIVEQEQQQQQQQEQPKSILRNESRTSNSNKVDRTSSMKAAEELRGQLPWSYFKARDDVPKKKVFNELNEDEDLPPVPVPDYTLHFSKTKRATISDSDGEGGGTFNRYDQRY